MECRISLSNRSRAPVIGLVAAVLFVSCSSGLWRSEAAAPLITPQCDKNEEVTSCNCGSDASSNTGADGKSISATLSESSNGITIHCPQTGFNFVPSEKTYVCTGGKTEGALKTCEGGNGKKSPITDFMIPVTESNSIAWTETSSTTKDYSLTLPPGSFPLVDKSFFAGCMETRQDNGNPKECLVTVSVTARTSTVKDGVLTCAYATDSNSSVLEVTLNSENNSLTIQCGSEGQMEPTQQSLTAYHCAGSNTTDCQKVNLTEIMPTFTSSWWTKDEQNSNAPKLVIPEDGFPAQEETIVLGCSHNNKGVSTDEEDEGDQTAAVELPTCKVTVTLGANTSGSQAPNVSFLGLFTLVFIPLMCSMSY
ncbi:srs domain-containing protein [Neospora caninum Liverpool]|uniref:Srs domain-containing protein n=1 Tax=Neospora caninum (strain Liverpool) TaxID=572307 RepID=F0VCF4_NEOCL|nr:srs domain-containing protein [Neospora caninum Liverpool]CBZ51276.1 srs domain-containing protein [Neospora caninum Liverpool]CEL68591.1 TPA: SRS domain-containing protein [Neospora caninum Liverpool]|eukprot:XP_003881309.1 srs domain-containing protein [Neospora caninum Liverpool]